VLRVNQEENSKREADEDSKENPFAVFLIVEALFGKVSGNGVPGQRGELGDGRESRTP
jgi:hypothetical protein